MHSVILPVGHKVVDIRFRTLELAKAFQKFASRKPNVQAILKHESLPIVHFVASPSRIRDVVDNNQRYIVSVD